MEDISRRKFMHVAGAAALSATALGIAGCSSSSDGTSSTSSASSSSASSSDSSSASSSSASATSDVTQLTYTPGKFTVATGDPTYPPYVLDDDPESGEGFEAALVYAVAEKMGFSKSDVVWVRTGFDEAITPGEKEWDVNIQQFGITEDRKEAVDFSSPYFTPTQSLVMDAAEGYDTYADATTIEEVQDALIGVESGSTSYTWAQDVVGEDNVAVFDSNAVAANALNTHQVDGLMLDTPTAVYMADPTMEELDAASLIGQVPGSEADPLAFVLPKGSALTDAVSDAIDELTAEGTLQDLTDTWMAEYTTDVPELK